jgi:hypothetical protein
MNNNFELKATTATIKGQEYKIVPFPAIPATQLFLRFTSIAGDSFKSFFSLADNNGFSGFGEGVALIFKAFYMNDPKCELILEIMSQTTRNGIAINRSTFDQFYTGNIEEMRDALIETIKVQFKGFLPLDRLSGVLSNIGIQTPESSENLTSL